MQGLRAVAALLVFAVHLSVLNVIDDPFTSPGKFWQLLNPLGEWGVDLFFVISGFVMITSTWNEFTTRAISLRFLARRLTRVYPLYWIVMLPIVALYFVSPNAINRSQAIRPSVAASLLLLPQIGKPLLTVSWTLVYEIFFYAVFAVVLVFGRRWCLPLLTAWGVLTILLAFACGPLHNVYLDTYANPLLLEFILGAFAGYLVRTRGVPFPIAAIVFGLAGIAAADLYACYGGITAAARVYGNLHSLCVGVPLTLVFLGVVGLETHRGLLFPRLLQRIGNASYSLYLCHVPLTILIARFLVGLRIHLNPLLHAVWLATTIVLVVGMSMVMHQRIERPLLRYFGGWIRGVEFQR